MADSGHAALPGTCGSQHAVQDSAEGCVQESKVSRDMPRQEVGSAGKRKVGGAAGVEAAGACAVSTGISEMQEGQRQRKPRRNL
eukprot:363544-Chlamydomonas_euryale.AAC.10